ncbi:MAG TPA: enolase C-terminal domain-like protein [Ramlibacter sp.]|uniref:enolase C-terminal domain-like protein n=1 Tax=Ramlibacter sp. TaxID=1917967 RepID=UPI002BFA629F|nr:enolase C-terminal domain-like protein [Ramlibacter sp.]HVZ45150.1 enolase C-terminal domain-like protein [Ramlibacter sp.]
MTTAAPRFTVREIELYERPVKLRLPFRFGVVTLTHSPQAFVRARIELAGGPSAWGAAAEMMAPKWFDKNLALTNEQNFEQLRQTLRDAREAYLADASPATGFGHFARNHDDCLKRGAARGFNPLLAGYGPAQVDRAVLDALGRALGLSFYRAIRENAVGIDERLRPEFAGLGIEAFLARLRPASSIEARHTVGLVDAITSQDSTQRVNDGLPETLEEVVRTYGHRYFKLKVAGRVDADLARLEAIAAVLDRSGEPYFASLDGNEQYESPEGVAQLVSGIRERPRLARLWQSILFIEQPIARKTALQVDLRAADLGKPVIVDESDGELDSFVVARRHGYSGISSKTCKGFYKSLLNAARCAAWNREENAERYFMSAEDLTTQAGLSVQQDLALVNLLGVRHVERNGHHYVNGLAAEPEGEQQAFLQAHPDVYVRSHGAVRLKIESGRIALGSLDCTGFASAAMPDFGRMTRLY